MKPDVRFECVQNNVISGHFDFSPGYSFLEAPIICQENRSVKAVNGNGYESN